MQTPINLWLWRYVSSHSRYAGYHLKADKAACQLLIDRINAPDFIKVSFALRAVPDSMPRILAPEDVKFVQFDKWRLRRDDTVPGHWRAEQNGSAFDMLLNTAGIERLSEGFGYMLEGQWDYSIEGIWFWGEPRL